MKALLSRVKVGSTGSITSNATGKPIRFEYMACGMVMTTVAFRKHATTLELRHVVTHGSWGPQASSKDVNRLMDEPLFASRDEIKRAIDRMINPTGLLISVGANTFLDAGSLPVGEIKKLAAFESTERLRGLHLLQETEFGNFVVESMDSLTQVGIFLEDDTDFIVR